MPGLIWVISIFLISFIRIYECYVHRNGKYIDIKLCVATQGRNSGGPFKRLSLEDVRSGPSTFAKILRSRSNNNSLLNRDELNTLSTFFKHQLNKVDTHNLPTIISSIGLINEKHKFMNKHDRDLLSSYLSTHVSHIKLEDISTILVASARLNLEWNTITKQNQEKELHYKIQKALHTCDAKSLGDILWSLGATGAQWYTLSSSLKNSLLVAIDSHINKFNLYQLPSTLWALSKMGLKWMNLSPETQNCLLSKLSHTSVEELNSVQASKVIWALGGLSYPLDLSTSTTADQAFLETLLTCVNGLKKSKMGFSLSASQTLSGLAKMNVKWDQLAVNNQKIVVEQAIRVFQGSNSQGIANALWAAGSIGIPINDSDMGEIMTSSVYTSIEDALNNSSGWELSNIVWGLSKMGYEYSSLPENILSAILNAVIRLSLNLNPVDVAILIRSLGSLNFPLDTMKSTLFMEQLYTALITTLPDMKASEITKVIFGMSATGLSWDDLPPKLHWLLNVALRREGKEMTSHDIANAAYGLTLLCFDSQTPSDAAFRGAHEVLLSNIISSNLYKEEESYSDALKAINKKYIQKAITNIQRIEEKEQIRIFLHYLKLMRADTTNKEKLLNQFVEFSDSMMSNTKSMISDVLLPSFTSSSSSSSISHTSSTALVALTSSGGGGNVGNGGNGGEKMTLSSSSAVSQLHHRMILSLQDAISTNDEYNKFTIQIEYSSFYGVFPTDVAIFYNNELVYILEVDGPHHYRFDGQLKRKDRLKETMYQTKYPDIILKRIRWDEIHKIGFDIISQEIIDQALITGRNMNTFTKSIRSIERSLGNFFSWGLRNTKIH